jgi:hypothetical protein
LWSEAEVSFGVFLLFWASHPLSHSECQKCSLPVRGFGCLGLYFRISGRLSRGISCCLLGTLCFGQIFMICVINRCWFDHM